MSVKHGTVWLFVLQLCKASEGGNYIYGYQNSYVEVMVH